jgi:hypothetical protein
MMVTRCTAGCAAGKPVCPEGKRLYERARAWLRWVPVVVDPRNGRHQRIMEEFWRAGDAYLAHIGQLRRDD